MHRHATPTRAPQASRLRRTAWVPVLAVGLALFEGIRQALLVTGNANLVPTLVLIGALVVPVTFVTFMTGRGFEVTVTGGALAATAVCGGVVGVGVAGLLEFDTLRHLGPAAVIGVAAIEEAAKLLVPLVLLARGPWRAVGDGLAIGLASGAGFAILETAGYTFVTAIHTHGSLDAIDDVLAVRGLLSPAGHMAWTGMCAAMLWAAASHRFDHRSVAKLIITLIMAVSLHALWDGIGTDVAYGVLAAIGLGSLALITRATRRMLPTPSRPAAPAVEYQPKAKETLCG